ncbi:MAG: hypothetical protein AAGI17_02310 [Planctomycetota bacterium]
MIQLSDGQCGLCEHFGDSNGGDKVVQLRVNGQAPDNVQDLVEPCGHPDNKPRDLKVSPLAGCAGFKRAS